MRRAVLELGAPAARHPARHGQLREPADERLGVLAQRERPHVALRLVGPLPRILPRQAHDQPEGPEHHERPFRQPVEREGGAERTRRDEPVDDRGDEPTAARGVVLEMPDFVREDGRLLARAEQLEGGDGEHHARHAGRRKGECVHEATARHRHLEQARPRGARAIEDRLPVDAPQARPRAHEPEEHLRGARRPQAEQQRERDGRGPPPDIGRLDCRRGQQQREPEAEPRDAEAELPEQVRRGSPALVQQDASRRIVADPETHDEREHGEPVVRPRPEGHAHTAQHRHSLRVLRSGEQPLRERGIVGAADETTAAPPGEHAGHDDERQERPGHGKRHRPINVRAFDGSASIATWKSVMS